MAIDFPSSPTTNQVYTYSGRSWIWNGAAWASVQANTIIYPSTPTFTSNAYTLVIDDAGKLLLASNGATAGTVNIPTNASVAFPVGTQVSITQTGSGQLTIQAASSGTTTVNSTGATATAPLLRVQYSSATCIKTDTDTWLVVGDIS